MTVFLRVDVVGRDGAGKTSLTKSLTLQEFDPDKLSTRGVVFDPKCQIIVQEACDWTTPLTSEHYRDMYNKNVTLIMAEALDTLEIKDTYFTSKEREKQQENSPWGDTVPVKSLAAAKAPERVDATGSLEFELSKAARVDSDPCNPGVQEDATDVKPLSGQQSMDFASHYSATVSDYLSVMADPSAIPLSPTSAQQVVVYHSTPKTKEGGTDPSADFQKGNQCVPFRPKQKRKVMEAKAEAVSVQQQKCQIDQGSNGNMTRSVETESPQCTVSESLVCKNSDKITDQVTKVPNHIKTRVSRYLRDKTYRQNAKGEMVVTILDYAGQHVFYATHQMCMSKAGFYYIVFDASKPLQDRTPSIFRVKQGEIVSIYRCDNETNYDRIEEWVSAIHVMETDDLRQTVLFEEMGIALPVIFLVGTHVDVLVQQGGSVKIQDDFMRKKLEGTVMAKHIVWASKCRMCFYVDNTLTNPDSAVVDPQVRLLRKKTEKLAQKLTQHHKLPITWLKFEEEVRELKKQDKTKKTALVEELLQLAMKAAGIKNKQELEVLLHYLSNRAVLLYCPKALKKGSEEVVLDVEWLISQLEKVITIHTDVPPMFRNDVTRTIEKGIMTSALLKYLLSDSGSAQHLIISLMYHFDLVCPYAGLEVTDLEQADDSKDFICLDGPEEDSCPEVVIATDSCDCFIPCLLEKSSPLESEQMDATLKTMPLLLSSAPLRIPQPLFYRVLTYLCKRFRRLPVLYSNVGYFHISPDHRLEFSLNRYSFQFSILSETKDPPRSIVCTHARDYIVHTVNALKLDGMAGLQLHIGFQLPGTYLSVSGVPDDDDDDFVSLDGFPDQRKVLYNSKNRQVEHPPELSMWYPQLEQKVGTFSL